MEVQDSQAQYFGQLLGRITYLGSQDLVYNGTVGVEYRAAGNQDEVNPILGLGLVWTPRLGTQFTVSGDSRVENSAEDLGYNYVTRSITLNISQRLGDALQLGGTVGYENADYSRTNDSVPAMSRNDNYVVIQTSLTALFNRHWDATIEVTYGDNRSRQDGDEFFQASLQLMYSF